MSFNVIIYVSPIIPGSNRVAGRAPTFPLPSGANVVFFFTTVNIRNWTWTLMVGLLVLIPNVLVKRQDPRFLNASKNRMEKIQLHRVWKLREWCWKVEKEKFQEPIKCSGPPTRPCYLLTRCIPLPEGRRAQTSAPVASARFLVWFDVRFIKQRCIALKVYLFCCALFSRCYFCMFKVISRCY